MKERMVFQVIDIRVVDMGLEHVDEVLAIEQLSFRTPWNRDAFVAEMTRNTCACYKVIMLGDRVISYGGMWVLLDEAHITNVAVHPEFRGMGIGNTIVEELIKEAKLKNIVAMTLEVRINNISAINLYKKYGFVEVAIRKNYYVDTGEDAIIMWKYDIQ